MTRFFFSEEERHGSVVVLRGGDARHLGRVLRAAPGDRIELCDGLGCCYSAEVIAVGSESVTCNLGDMLPGSEASIRFTLAFGLLKGDKTEMLLEKATELGTACFLPFAGERTIVRLDAKKAAERTLRWQKIVRSAAAQSRRDCLPEIMPICDWQGLLAMFPGFARVVLFYEQGGSPLTAALSGLSPGEGVLLITGPEGGFSAMEAEEARKRGAFITTLGPRILRAETAAVMAVALSLYEVGELGGKT